MGKPSEIATTPQKSTDHGATKKTRGSGFGRRPRTKSHAATLIPQDRESEPDAERASDELRVDGARDVEERRRVLGAS
jgi:hypothetical protein